MFATTFLTIFLYRALEAACAAYASLNLSLLHYTTFTDLLRARFNAHICVGCQRRSVVYPSVVRRVVIYRKLSKIDP